MAAQGGSYCNVIDNCASKVALNEDGTAQLSVPANGAIAIVEAARWARAGNATAL